MVTSIEDHARLEQQKREVRRVAKQQRRAQAGCNDATSIAGSQPAEVLLPDGTHETVRRGENQPKALAGELDLNKPVELVVLSVRERAGRCRL